jgi:hypothetical protein
MQKMSLIPHEMVEKLMYQQRHKEDTRPLDRHAINLDREMQEILSKNDSDEYKKAMLYMQLLNKYLGTLHSQDIPKTQHTLQMGPQIPQPLHQPEHAKTDSPGTLIEPVKDASSSPISVREIVENIPKYARTRARKITSILNEDPNFHWDMKGQIAINGKTIEGSDIRKIVRNASTNPKQQLISPVGLDPVLAYVRSKGHIPAKAIINKIWKKELNISETPRTSLTRWLSPSTPAFASPTLSGRGKNYGWESWK